MSVRLVFQLQESMIDKVASFIMILQQIIKFKPCLLIRAKGEWKGEWKGESKGGVKVMKTLSLENMVSNKQTNKNKNKNK